mgnify:CR=1 FL=1
MPTASPFETSGATAASSAPHLHGGQFAAFAKGTDPQPLAAHPQAIFVKKPQSLSRLSVRLSKNYRSSR